MPIITLSVIAAVSTATYFAGGAGAIAGGAGASIFWRFFKSKEEKSENSPKKQQKTTRDRINAAREEVDGLHPKVKVVAAEVKAASAATTKSASSLAQSTEKLSKASQDLKEAAKTAKSASDNLGATGPLLATLTKKAQDQTAKITPAMNHLHDQLAAKKGELEQAKGDINALTHTVDEQAAALTTLQDTVGVLTAKNEEQQETINHMEKKITTITEETKRLSANCQFFKAVAQQVIAKKEGPNLDGVVTLNGMNA